MSNANQVSLMHLTNKDGEIKTNLQSSIYDDAEEDDTLPSQVTLSQCDELIRTYGTANEQVAGSQSILSQELISNPSSQPESNTESDSRFGTLLSPSVAPESSKSMAKRLGLLIQEDESSPRSQVGLTPPNNYTAPKVGLTSTARVVPSAPLSTGDLLRDTPIRQSECFGSLLDAVQKITEQEEVNDKLYSLQQSALDKYNARVYGQNATFRRSSPSIITSTAAMMSTMKRKSPSSNSYSYSSASTSSDEEEAGNFSIKRPRQGARKVAQKVPSKALPQIREVEIKLKRRNVKSTPTEPREQVEQLEKVFPKKVKKASSAKASSTKKRSSKKKSEQLEAQEIATRAAALAEQTVADPEMAKKLLLSMALVRENPRTEPARWPGKGHVVKEGFFWAHYPPLEAVLKKHMARYYELSTTKCQSAQQQAFNNELVVIVKQAADEQMWEFDKAVFDDKALRDRIRCYYKTHIQNAKKRLRTMIRNPTKRANARHLCAHLDLIEENHDMPRNIFPGDPKMQLKFYPQKEKKKVQKKQPQPSPPKEDKEAEEDTTKEEKPLEQEENENTNRRGKSGRISRPSSKLRDMN